MTQARTLKRLTVSTAGLLAIASAQVSFSGPGESSEAIASPVADAGMQPVMIEMKTASGSDAEETLGTITVRQLVRGLLIEPAINGLKTGLHGFHLHENESCGSTAQQQENGVLSNTRPAGEAGGHWDPGIKGSHGGPWGRGHRGDLPNLYVDPDGVASLPVYAPRLTLRDLQGRALVIHQTADNYTDEPDDKGGSGQAVACGVLRNWDPPEETSE